MADFKFPEFTEHVEVDQSTDDWLALKAGMFSGSECKDRNANGRGGAPSKTVESYVFRKATERLTGRCISNVPSTPAIQWGKDQEDFALARYAELTGFEVSKMGILLHKEFNWAGSLDGKVSDDLDIEIKCPNTDTHFGYAADGPPKHYLEQMQWNMALSGAKQCDFITFDPRVKDCYQIFVFRIDRDDALIAQMHERAFDVETAVQKKLDELKSSAFAAIQNFETFGKGSINDSVRTK